MDKLHLSNCLCLKSNCRVNFLMRYSSLCLFFILSHLLFAQADTLKNIQLKDLMVVDKSVDKAFSQSLFSVGTNLQVADSAVLSQLQNNSLSEYLLRNTPVFIKESGNGMLSSISLRGTASSHTAVTWNGLTINPLTMGQIDFSQLPLFFFDKVAVHPGGESALYGNGAIGGSILLGSANDYKKNWSGMMQQTLGSYDYSFSGLKIQGGTDKWQSKTALMYNQCENDFDIQQNTFSGIKTEKQQNASFISYGFLQDLSFRLSSKNELIFNAWHTYYYREIQPSIQNNLDTATYDNISNRNTILLATFKHKAKLCWESRMAYINDYQLNLKDIIASQQFVVSADANKTWRDLSIKTGFSAQYIVPQVYSYDKNVTEMRADVYALSRWQINSAWNLTCNFRQAAVSNIEVPFTPSMGIEKLLIHNSNQSMHVRYNISRSFKVPTLNDRYWGGLDNRYLKPEDGLNNELGFDYSIEKNKYSLQVNVAVYYNRVQNWIMWMPRGDIWKPQNVDLVGAKGIEANVKQSYSWYNCKISLLLNYAFTQTIVLKGFSDMTPFLGRQMPLLPEHTANGLLQLENRHLFLNMNTIYVGERSTSNVFDIMSAYVVSNASAGYNFNIKKQVLSFSVQVNNLFGEQYQTVPYKAMPMQNFSATLKYIY